MMRYNIELEQKCNIKLKVQRRKSLMNMDKKKYILHYAVSTLGGFFGGYAIFNHCDLFGNAQTANLIHIVCKIFSADFSGLIFLIASLLTYIAGIVFCVLSEHFIKIDLRIISLVMSAAAIGIIGFFPNISNHYVALLPILFVTPMLWSAFRTAGSYVTSPIFSTNNLRVATASTTSYLITKDKSLLAKAKFYWLTIASFHAGVAMACVLSVFFKTNSIWFGLINVTLAIAAYLWVIGFSYINKRARRARHAIFNHAK